MKKFSLLIKSIAFMALMLPTFLLAEEKRVAMQEEIEKAIPLFEEEELDEEMDLFPDATRSGFSFREPQDIYYPPSTHWVENISFPRDAVTIEDGSVWSISSSDKRKMDTWRDRTLLTITQNKSWFTSYDFLLVDQNNRAVRANLKLAPIETNEYTNFISLIDRRRRMLALTNRMNLLICPADEKKFSRWQEGQAIIIGSNSGDYKSRYPLLLINVFYKNTVRAQNVEVNP